MMNLRHSDFVDTHALCVGLSYRKAARINFKWQITDFPGLYIASETTGETAKLLAEQKGRRLLSTSSRAYPETDNPDSMYRKNGLVKLAVVARNAISTRYAYWGSDIATSSRCDNENHRFEMIVPQFRFSSLHKK